MTQKLTHFGEDGRPRMVDVSDKRATDRRAVARGRVEFSRAAYDVIRAAGVSKGDLASTAVIAGVMAAKKTSDIIPLCHPLALSGVDIDIAYHDADAAIDVTATVKTTGATGVEMEALTAVSVACLTIYDMAKAIDKSMRIGPIELVEKTGGKSGDYRREA